MGAMSAEAANAVPAGFTRVSPVDAPKPVVKVKDAAVPASKASDAPAPQAQEVAATPAADDSSTRAPGESGEGAPPLAEESGVQVAEPSKLEKAKAAAAKAKRGAEQNRKLMAEAARLRQDGAQQADRTRALEGEIAQLRSTMEAIGRDPVAAFKALGITPAELAKRVAMDGSPEAQIQALQARLQETETRLERQAQESRDAQAATSRAEAENAYKQQAQDPKKYPNLAGVNPSFILSRTREILADLSSKYRSTREEKYNPKRITNHQLLEFLDYENAPKSAAPKSAAEAPSAAPENGGKKTATITNKLQSAKHAAPVDFSKMNDRQQRKIMAQQLRDAGLASH